MGGVVAVGDSNTRGTTRAVGAFPCRSYARWVADALDLPVEVHARAGASAWEIRRDLIPEVDGSFDLALLYVGLNDVLRAGPIAGAELRSGIGESLMHLRAHAARVAVLTIPPNSGRLPTMPYGPRRAARIAQVNDAIADEAGGQGVEIVRLPPFTGRHVVWADHIHMAAFGQVAIADEVVRQLRLPVARPGAVHADEMRAPGARWELERAWWYAKALIRTPPQRLAATIYRQVRPRQTATSVDQRRANSVSTVDAHSGEPSESEG